MKEFSSGIGIKIAIIHNNVNLSFSWKKEKSLYTVLIVSVFVDANWVTGKLFYPSNTPEGTWVTEPAI